MTINGWSVETVEACLERIAIPSASKLQTKDYRASGKYPVIDQGQAFIAGWTDAAAGVISAPLPLIVFGDHTRTFKFVNFPFVRGADGTQLLKPRDGIDPLYFYYACRAIDLPSRGYNRHFTILKTKEIQLPSRKEQQEIASVLRQVESGLEVQNQQLEASENLKRATMRELFTRGLRGESQKETEIGPVPESWSVAPIGRFTKLSQYGLSIRGNATGRYPILRMNCQQDGRVVLRDLQYIDLDHATAQSFRVSRDDLLFNRTNSYELVGRTAIVEGDIDAVFASYLIRLSIDNERLLPRYLNYFLNWDFAQSELKKLASRAVGQANINATKLSGFTVPVPTIDEQREIVAVLDAIDRKIDLHRNKRVVLDELFKALLHKLMIGEIRVADLDLSGLTPVRVAEAAQ
jgi:type I restriction enzyme S subunit